uniref:Anasin n=1 Tax=Anasa tristis TaxID=236421 RepID=W0FVL6_ANATI|nr:anasin [Anasa tristis]
MNISFVTLLLALSCFEGTSTTFIEGPVERFDDLPEDIAVENPLGGKHHVNVRSIGVDKESTLNIDAHKKIFDNGKTRIVASASGHGVWKSSHPIDKSATLRLDAEKNLFKNGNTIVNGKAFMERSVAKGFHAHNVFGAGLEFSSKFHESRSGAVIETHGRYQKLWFSKHKHIAELGMKLVY